MDLHPQNSPHSGPRTRVKPSLAADADADQLLLHRLGRWVSHRRLELGRTQEDVAAEAGVHRTTLVALEAGRRDVPVTTLVRVAGALAVSPGELLGGGGVG